VYSKHFICCIEIAGHLGNSLDKLRHTRSVAYSAKLVLLNKHQISGGGAYLDCYRHLPHPQQHGHSWRHENKSSTAFTRTTLDRAFTRTACNQTTTMTWHSEPVCVLHHNPFAKYLKKIIRTFTSLWIHTFK